MNCIEEIEENVKKTLRFLYRAEADAVMRCFINITLGLEIIDDVLALSEDDSGRQMGWRYIVYEEEMGNTESCCREI